MSKLMALLDDYAVHHRHPINQLTHKIGVPIVVYNALAMFDWLDLFTIATVPVVGPIELSVGHLVAVAATAWYFTLSWRVGAVLGGFSAAMLALSAVSPWPVVVAAGIVGWAVQFAGHWVWEKNQPAFFKNLTQFLIGPLFVAALVTGDWVPAKKRV